MLRSFNIDVEEAKLAYLKREKAGSLARVDLSDVTVEQLQRIIADRITASYIYQLAYSAEHDVAKFNIIIEAPLAGKSVPTRLLAALEYQSATRTLRLITLY